MDERVTVRLSGSQATKLDAMAGASGCSRSTVLRRLLDGAGEVAVPAEREQLDRDEVLRLAEESARNGSTAAQRMLLDEHRIQEGAAEVARLNALARGD